MKIIELPREAMQTSADIMPRDVKVKYLNTLIKAGFDTVEIGSIVSPKYVPQMADTMEIIQLLDYSTHHSNTMVLVVNTKGGEILGSVDEITHYSYPFSISPAFLKLNINATIDLSLASIGELLNICDKKGKDLVLYLAMAFGNPYGDLWSIDLLMEWVRKFSGMGVKIMPLSNVSVETDETVIGQVFSILTSEFPGIEFGLHLHTSGVNWYEKVDAAYRNGCRRFDSVIDGLGGCPMSGEKLLGNLKTQSLVEFVNRNAIDTTINCEELNKAIAMASEIF